MTCISLTSGFVTQLKHTLIKLQEAVVNNSFGTFLQLLPNKRPYFAIFLNKMLNENEHLRQYSNDVSTHQAFCRTS